MTAKIIDGKKIASEIAADIKNKVKDMKVKPGLAVVLVGNNPASQLYVDMKEKKCHEVGFHSKKIVLPEDTDEVKLLEVIDQLNQDKKIHGMLVQMPLPKHINEQLIIDAILPHKDADGLNALNLGNMIIGTNLIVPATPKGVLKLIESTGIQIEGKHAVVIGRSNLVGKPIAMLLQQKNATVTMCHSRTKNIEKFTKDADILVVAVGRPNMVTGSMIKKGAVVIDVGTSKVNGKLVGDVEFESAKKVASFITPVPGGVGPMTIAMLLENTLQCMEIASRL